MYITFTSCKYAALYILLIFFVYTFTFAYSCNKNVCIFLFSLQMYSVLVNLPTICSKKFKNTNIFLFLALRIYNFATAILQNKAL